MPFTSLDDRLSELVSRSEKYRTHPKLPELITSARLVESQIQSQIKIDLTQILPTQLPHLDLFSIELI